MGHHMGVAELKIGLSVIFKIEEEVRWVSIMPPRGHARFRMLLLLGFGFALRFEVRRERRPLPGCVDASPGGRLRFDLASAAAPNLRFRLALNVGTCT